MRKLMKGNDALAEAAVRAGCRFFGGYPITPQSEILEYLAWRMPQVGGHFVQTESELAGINMVYGAAAAGYRALTSSSGPGFSLLQEGISYLASAELPAVVVDVMRYGIGLGVIIPGQCDYYQAVKGGGHGGYRALVYAPSTVQEAVDYTYDSFGKAEKYRNPVLILSDGAIGQMAEAVELPEMIEHDPDTYDWALKGKGRGSKNGRKMTDRIYYDFKFAEYDPHMRQKYAVMKEEEQQWEEVGLEDAEIALVSYGISSRICKEAVKTARRQGLKLGLIRPVTLWPFPVKAFEGLNKKIRGFLAVEMNSLGQMVEDVLLAARGQRPVYLYASGRVIPEAATILQMAQGIMDRTLQEVN